ncbi:MAG TPA: hypothetical protein VF522_09635 [Ramlibacter sp.]|uniref:hypothetical protein n=1 Tax=Ramlibacter sp. TaxID=1917967 RepID=UPI002ED6C187
MRHYRNLSGNSGVVAYEVGPDWIGVKFRDGVTYRYTYAKPGAIHVEEMKKLAAAGRGLSGYISRHVGKAYESTDG